MASSLPEPASPHDEAAAPDVRRAPARRRRPAFPVVRPGLASGERDAGRGDAVADVRGLAAPGLAAALGVALGSRLALFGVALVAVGVVGVKHVARHLLVPRIDVPHGQLGRLLDPWTHWDGVWYWRVAAHGYTTVADAAFYPLYPLAMRGAAGLLGSYVLAGVVVSTVCFVAAATLLYRLLAKDFSPRVAFWAVALLSVFPTSFFFQAVYRESLFLLLSVACFWAARHGRWLLAGLLGLLAVLAHATGLLLVVPIALSFIEEGRRSGDWSRVRLLRGAAGLGLVPAGMFVYMGYLAVTLGDPTAFMQAEHDWGRRLTAPWTTVWQGIQAGYHGLQYLLAGFATGTGATWPLNPGMAFGNLIALIALVVAALLLALGWRRLPLAYSAYALAVVVYPLLFSTQHRPLLSLPRLILPAFPLFVAAAARTERRPALRWTLVCVSTVALAYLTVRFVHFSWVA